MKLLLATFALAAVAADPLALDSAPKRELTSTSPPPSPPVIPPSMPSPPSIPPFAPYSFEERVRMVVLSFLSVVIYSIIPFIIPIHYVMNLLRDWASTDYSEESRREKNLEFFRRKWSAFKIALLYYYYAFGRDANAAFRAATDAMPFIIPLFDSLLSFISLSF